MERMLRWAGGKGLTFFLRGKHSKHTNGYTSTMTAIINIIKAKSPNRPVEQQRGEKPETS